MVMMHMYRDRPEDVIVAHFDHGIRDNSGDDYAFVEKKSEQYGYKFVGRHAKLGADSSEEKARTARYDFLRQCAEEFDAKIYTAHHADDIIESIIINLLRGTGWRGLAPINNREVERPLRGLSKSDIYRYAAINQLSFRQDQTNTDDKYLRNRIRAWFLVLDREEENRLKSNLLRMYAKQCMLSREISEILEVIPTDETYSREFFKEQDSEIAIEVLRQILSRYDISLTRPQLSRALEAICEYGTSTKFSLKKDAFLSFSRGRFSVDLCKN